MKYTYRKKGKYTDGGAKIMIDRRNKKELKSKQLPKPKVLWDGLKRLKMIEGLRDVENHALSEPLMNEKNHKQIKCKYCENYFIEYDLKVETPICNKCLIDFREEIKRGINKW